MARKKSVTLTRKRLIYAILLGLTLNSCTAVRTVQTTAESKRVDDSHIVIQTQVTETYIGKKQ